MQRIGADFGEIVVGSVGGKHQHVGLGLGRNLVQINAQRVNFGDLVAKAQEPVLELPAVGGPLRAVAEDDMAA